MCPILHKIRVGEGFLENGKITDGNIFLDFELDY